MHPSEQDPCGKMFIRAGSLVDHVEKNECPGINIAHFDRFRAVHALREHLLSTLSHDDDGGVSHSTTQTATETTGGVALEHDQEQYIATWPSLAPEPILSHQNRSKVEDRSRRHPEQPSTDSNKTTLLLGAAASSSSFAESVVLMQGIVGEHEDKGKAKAPAWAGASSAAQSLFPEPMQKNMQAALAEMLTGTPQQEPIHKFSNGQPVDAANPDSRQYNPGAFRNILGSYQCPYPGCTSVK